MRTTFAVMLLITGLNACSPRPAAPAPAQTAEMPPPPVAAPSPPASGLREVFPGVRVDAGRGVLEFDGEVCIDPHSTKTPRVFLEAFVCIPDSKEHESLVVTKALPSHIHAGLLLLNLQPGTPGTWDWEGAVIKPVPPTGPGLRITAEWTKGPEQLETPLTDWVMNVRDNRTLTESSRSDRFVFAGSQMLPKQSGEVYRADGEGCVIGLCAFGGETIAWSRLYSPDSSLEEPQWAANAAHTPPFGTRVVVRIRRED